MTDAVPPMGSPTPGATDLAYASMEYEWQRAVVRPLAGKLGLPPGTVLFTLALFASVPLGAVFQFIPGAAAKNLYSLVAGRDGVLTEGGVWLVGHPCSGRLRRDGGAPCTMTARRRSGGGLRRGTTKEH
jgi:hypothetical protein